MIYLDNSATTKVAGEVIQEMVASMEKAYGNPSSLHRMGLDAEKMVRRSRKTVAAAIGADEKEIIFTSGGTESDNLAILGAAKANERSGKHIITSKLEHKAVLEPFEALRKIGYEVSYVANDETGLIDEDNLMSMIRPDTILVSIMHVNNETGKVNDIFALSKAVKRANNSIIFHSDGVQSLGKIDFSLRGSDVDMMSFSGHKIHGPKGVGALYVKNGVKLNPIVFGGGQERAVRPGTENVPGIVGMGKAVEICRGDIVAARENAKRQMDRLLRGVVECVDFAKPIGHRILENGEIDTHGYSPFVASVSFEGLRGEVLLHSLETEGVFVSTGSACNSKAEVFSHVLNGLGLSSAVKDGSIRFSVSRLTTDNEIDEALKIVAKTANDLAEIMIRRKR